MSSSENYFQLFGLPLSYDVDLESLTARYRELQKATHPDKFASAGDRERRLSVQQAAQVNDGFSTLKSPLNRAIYLLKLHGVTLNPNSTAMDPMFLMEQMSLREALADIPSSKDPLQGVADFLDKTAAMKSNLSAELSAQFCATPVKLEDAEQTVKKFQFIEKLHQEAEQLEADLEDQ